MARISTALTQPGMILAEDVNAPGGQLIAGAGATLSAKHLVAFKTWGIPAVMITDESAPAIDPALLAEARRLVAPRFAGQPTDHPAIREIFRIGVERQVALKLAKRVGTPP